MKVDRSEMDLCLKIYLNDLTKEGKNDIKNNIKLAMMQRGYNEFETNRIINLNVEPKLLSEFDIFTLCCLIHKIDTTFEGYQNLKEPEIQIGENYTKEKILKNDNELRFENVIQSIEDKQWIAVVPIKDIAMYMKNHLIEYDTDFQRETIKKYNKKSHQVIEELNINKNKVKEISNVIKSEKYFGEAISIVCLRTGEEKFAYSEAKKNIIITEDSRTKVFCPDGFHRIMAFSQIVEFNDNIKQNTEVRILHLTEEETAEYISQIDKHTPLLATHSKMYDQKDVYIQIAKDIDSKGNNLKSYIFKKAVEDLKDLKFYTDKYYSFETIARSIQILFFNGINKPDPRKLGKVAEFVYEGLNEIVGILQEKNLNNKAYYENNTFIGYIAVLQKLYGIAEWKSQLEKIIEDLDLSNASEYTNFKVSKTAINKVADFFINQLKINKLYEEVE